MPDLQATFLEAEAHLGGAFLHPGGRVATACLLDFLAPQPGHRILELGCGPGTTTVLVARHPDVSVIAVDQSRAMLDTARRRIERAGLASRVRFIRTDLTEPLPLPDESCDAVHAESVIALMEPESVLREAGRILCPGGRLGLNERIWRSGVSAQQVERINRLSLEHFGIPAATPTPLDRAGWVEILEQTGFEIDAVVPVAGLPVPSDQGSRTGARLRRYRYYLKHPGLIWRQAQFKRALHRHRAAFNYLESFLFFARKPQGNPE